MFIVKCMPFVGTAVSVGEAIGELVDGNGRGFLAKTAQATISGALDVAFVVSGGASSLITAPLKGGAIEGGKLVGKKALEQLLVKEAATLTTNVAARAVTEIVADKVSGSGAGGFRSGGGGSRSKSTTTGSRTHANTNKNQSGSGAARSSSNSGGNGPQRNPQRQPGEHEKDYDTEVELSESNPVTAVDVGIYGRPESLTARIFFRHLRARQGDDYSDEVERFLKRMGWLDVYSEDENGRKVADGDAVGHLVAATFNGPSDKTYNFVPMSPLANSEYLHKVENPIRKFLKQQQEKGNNSAFVELHVEVVYVDYYKDWAPNRPRAFKVKVSYSDGRVQNIYISN